MMLNCGVYIIASPTNNTVYIGSTINFRKRWSNHKGLLRRGAHDNLHLQRAWNLYDEDAFEFGVLEYLDDPKELHPAEQFWMDIYREEGYKLYNFGLAARHAMLGRAMSEETRRKLSKAQEGNQYALGFKHTKETRQKVGRARARPYPAFIHRGTGEIIPAGHNLKALCRKRGLCQSAMCAVKNGRWSHYKGWMLQEVYE